MKLAQRVKRRFKPFFDISSWMSKDFLVAPAVDLSEKTKRLFIVQQSSKAESFEMAVNRLNISEQALLTRLIEMRRMFFLFLLIGLGLLIYGVLSLLQGFFLSFFICAGLTCFAFSMAFKYHFWIFQIKQRRLGCSLREWLKGTLWGKSH